MADESSEIIQEKPKKKRGRPPGATDDKRTRKILQLHAQGVSQPNIAKIIDRDVAQVNRTIKRFRELINVEELKEFREFKLDLIDSVKLKTLKSMAEDSKHTSAPLRDLGMVFKNLNEASRLERALPTKAQAVVFTRVNRSEKEKT